MSELTELHENNCFIATEAVAVLRAAATAIEERDKCYNSNGINFEDYMIMGIESSVQQQLECLVRFHNSLDPDKAVDLVAYSALHVSLVKAGVPQSIFSPIFRRYIPEMYQGMKKEDCAISVGEALAG